MAFLAGLTTASCRRNSWRGCGRVRAADTGHDPERLAARLLNDARRRVKALGQVFGELASGYDSPGGAPDERAVIGRMRARLCRGFNGCRACWDGSDGRAGRLMCELVTRTAAGEAIGEADELPRRWRACAAAPRRSRKKLGPLLKAFSSSARVPRQGNRRRPSGNSSSRRRRY